MAQSRGGDRRRGKRGSQQKGDHVTTEAEQSVSKLTEALGARPSQGRLDRLLRHRLWAGGLGETLFVKRGSGETCRQVLV